MPHRILHIGRNGYYLDMPPKRLHRAASRWILSLAVSQRGLWLSYVPESRLGPTDWSSPGGTGPVAASSTRPDQDPAGPVQDGTSGRVAASRNVMQDWDGQGPLPALCRERLVEVNGCWVTGSAARRGGGRRHV
jgi:hypothetical protein